MAYPQQAGATTIGEIHFWLFHDYGRKQKSSLSTGPAIPNEASFDGFCTQLATVIMLGAVLFLEGISTAFSPAIQPSARNSIPRGFQLSKYLIHLIFVYTLF